MSNLKKPVIVSATLLALSGALSCRPTQVDTGSNPGFDTVYRTPSDEAADLDGDGYSNSEDLCPSLAGHANSFGCPGAEVLARVLGCSALVDTKTVRKDDMHQVRGDVVFYRAFACILIEQQRVQMHFKLSTCTDDSPISSDSYFYSEEGMIFRTKEYAIEVIESVLDSSLQRFQNTYARSPSKAMVLQRFEFDEIYCFAEPEDLVGNDRKLRYIIAGFRVDIEMM